MNPRFMLILQEGIRLSFVFMTNGLFKLVDGFFALMGRFLVLIEDKISFTFIVAVCATIAAWFGTIYGYLFAGLNITGWVIEDIYYELVTFIFATTAVTFFNFIYFGIFHRLGFSGIHKSIREMNRSFDRDYYKSLSDRDDDYLLSLLDAVIFLPVHAVLISLIEILFIAILIAVVYFYQNWNNLALGNYIIILIGGFGGELIMAGFTYIFTDYFTGSKRIKIKRILQARGINCNNRHGLFMLKEKFMILLLGLIFGIAVLVMNSYLGRMTLFQTISFLAISSFAVGFLLFMYLNSIVVSLDQIREAAGDLAQGGRGSLPMIATEHEFIGFASSFEKASEEVYQIRKNLQEKVEEKTYELRQSLDELSQLKQQQDGDYLLTSFLLDPLAQNTVTGDKVKVDFFIEQNKKLKFKKWDKELGGDICIAHMINLAGRQYVVFINADAMGKSMQGAGGALVFGATFQSIVERTRFIEVMQDSFPERWLKNAFIELHRLFQTFDSRMLVSMFFGLVDAETGLMYYINAEHPRSVVFRNKSAGYLEKEIEFYKLGSPGIGSRIHSSTFQMMPGDVVIAASDGRDNILLGIDDDGSRIIGSDEERFLNAVEKGEGNIGKIYDYIIARGELTDDISILRIEYVENAARRNELELNPDAEDLWRKAREAYSESETGACIVLMEKALTFQENNIIILKDIIRFHYKAMNYEKVISYAERYIEREDGDSDILYILSVCYKKVNNYDKAMALAVRLRLRVPDMVQNLLHLSELNVLLGSPQRIKRAKKYCAEALEIEPQNETARKIQEHINSLKSDA